MTIGNDQEQEQAQQAARLFQALWPLARRFVRRAHAGHGIRM